MDFETRPQAAMVVGGLGDVNERQESVIPRIQRFAIVAISPNPRSLLSAVAKVRFTTFAVAARNLSAGSPWGRGILCDSTAISCVRGASRKGAVLNATQSSISRRNRI